MSYRYSFASVYDTFTENVEYKKRAKYIYSLLSRFGIKTGTLLDAACGTGSLTKEFLELGFEAVAVDISPYMLMRAREKLISYGDKALILCQDIRSLDLYGAVDCAVCSLDSINHLLKKDDVRAAFKSISMFVRSGGVFVFDVNTLFKHKNILAGNTFVYENDSSFLVWQNSECDKDGKIDIMLDIFSLNENGTYSRESEDFGERAYRVDFLTEELNKSGFNKIEVYGDLSKNKAMKNDMRIYFVAVKD